MKILRGKKIADEILVSLKKKIITLKNKPHLAVILVGENKASKLYIKLKAQAAEKIGVKLTLYKFKSNAKEKDIIKLIKSLNKDKKINAILVQLPLPRKLKTDKIISAINPAKDADGFHSKNIRKFLISEKFTIPVFPRAIMKLLEKAQISLENKKAIILTNSEVFGKIMSTALKRKKIDSQTILKSDFDRKINLLKSADIIITAVGRPKLIKGKMIKKGAIIIDGGITKQKKKVLGDVDFSSVAKVARGLSPVPGGVGPMTIACLLENVYRLTLAQEKK